MEFGYRIFFNAYFIFVLSMSVVHCVSVNEELEVLRTQGISAYASLHGMNLTVYQITTSDGWILELHRILNPKVYNANLSTPVLLSHGFACSSFDFIANGRNESLGFILADNGFDVWAVNYRSNAFSKKIVDKGEISAAQGQKFFGATWQNMAEVDLPAVIDKILSETKQSKLYIVGHSMGTTVVFAGLSENDKYDRNIIHFAAITPVLKLGNDTSAFLKFVMNKGYLLTNFVNKHAHLLKILFNCMYGNQPFEIEGSFNKRRSQFCGDYPRVCEIVYTSVYDRNISNMFWHNPHLRKERFPLYMDKTPAGIGLIAGYDFATEFNRELWSKIDYSKIPLAGFTNEEVYGKHIAPTYNFSAIRVDYSLTFVKNDVFVGLTSALKIVEELRTKNYRLVDGIRMNHMDVLYSRYARCYIYDNIVAKFRMIEKSRDEDRFLFHSVTVSKHLSHLQIGNPC